MEFLAAADTKIALSKDKEYMGSRFCHVTKTTAEERDYTLAKQSEGDFTALALYTESSNVQLFLLVVTHVECP